MNTDPARFADTVRLGGCICVIPGGHPYGYDYAPDAKKQVWRINPDCPYHKAATARPWDHRIPWNCPTYWDGCNCEGGPFYEPPAARIDGSDGAT